MKTLFVGQNLIELKEVDSTNNFAATMLNATNLADGTVIMAYHQVAGKGQRGNIWSTENGKNLTFTVVMSHSVLTGTEGFDLSRVAALSIADYLSAKHHLSPLVKWPNDIYVNKQKIAGILIESIYRGNRIKNTLIGVGININQTRFDEELKATSLALETQKEYDLKTELKLYLPHLEQYFLKLRSKNGVEKIREEYLQKLWGCGEDVSYIQNQSIQKGRIAGISARGKIRIEKQGIIEEFEMKEIKLLL